MARSRNPVIRFLTSDARRLFCLFGRHHWNVWGRERVCPYCHKVQHLLRPVDAVESVWIEDTPNTGKPSNERENHPRAVRRTVLRNSRYTSS